jgi:hypothetical protein
VRSIILSTPQKVKKPILTYTSDSFFFFFNIVKYMRYLSEYISSATAPTELGCDYWVTELTTFRTYFQNPNPTPLSDPRTLTSSLEEAVL